MVQTLAAVMKLIRAGGTVERTTIGCGCPTARRGALLYPDGLTNKEISHYARRACRPTAELFFITLFLYSKSGGLILGKLRYSSAFLDTSPKLTLCLTLKLKHSFSIVVLNRSRVKNEQPHSIQPPANLWVTYFLFIFFRARTILEFFYVRPKVGLDYDKSCRRAVTHLPGKGWAASRGHDMLIRWWRIAVELRTWRSSSMHSKS